MLYASIPSTSGRSLPYFLAAEEWIAARMPAAHSYFFAWQVAPTVICGRNQDMQSEVDMDFCRRRGIAVWRRKSGGGAVYADNNNIMFSYIGPRSSVQDAFGCYTDRVVGALRSLGIDAEVSGRNDICIAGRKVAGNAFMQARARNIVHGTMLFDADFATMAAALTPGRAKLESKRVHSVPSRVTTVRAHRPDLTIDAFMRHIVGYVCDGHTSLPYDAVDEIMQIEQSYRHPGFRYGGVSRSGQPDKARYIPGVGQILARTGLSNGLIADVSISGDFFADDRLHATLDELRGIQPEIDAVLSKLGPDMLVAGLPNEALARLIVDNTF